MTQPPTEPGDDKDRLILALLGGGSLVGGIAMIFAQSQAPGNTTGQSIFTTIVTLLLVAGIWAMVFEVRNRLAQEGVAKVPLTPPWRVAELGCWVIALILGLLVVFMLQVVINRPTSYAVGNLIASLGWGACAVGGGMLLRRMRNQYDQQWTPPKSE